MKVVHPIFKYKSFFLFCVILGVTLFAFSHVSAAAGDTFGINRVGSVLPLGGEDIRVIAAKIIRIFLSLLGVIAVGLMLYAGFTWMTSGGNEEKIASAKKILINATIGLVIIMSSFAITQFILNSLQDATGSGGRGNENGGNGGVFGCVNFAECQNLPDGPHECADEGFVVKSLTPRTPTNNGTGMSNTVIRAVFSKPLDADQDVNTIFKVTRDATHSVSIKDIKILGNRQIVEAYFSNNTGVCNSENDESCLSLGEYHIEVNPDLVAGGVKLQTKLNCGDFDNTSNFTVNKDFLDRENPIADSITLNGKKASQQQNLARGSKYKLNATFEDRRKLQNDNTQFGGLSYLALNVKSEPKEAGASKTNWSYYTGPKGSSNDLIAFSQDLIFGDEFPVPSLYTLTFDVSDIDHNNQVVVSTFILDGELCHNGKQDAGETGIDIGGKCLGDGECSADWQCMSGDCDEGIGQCVNRPVIQDIDVGGVDPNSWDGAPGSWATIIGSFFGNDPGSVEFGIDSDKNGSVDQWVQAPLANCNGLDVWNNRQVIVEIPNIPAGTSTTVRIKTRAVGQKISYEDESTDEKGPKSGPHLGIFTISNNDHPGLCSVLNPITNTNVASTTAPVTAFGRALGNGQNSTLLFGGVSASVRQWQEQTILSAVPQNLKPGSVGVRAKIGDNYTNQIEFIVVDKDADLVPHIESISPTPSTTAESLVTLIGSHFGAPGVAYIAPTKQGATTCATTNDAAVEANCARIDVINLPQACGNTWQNTQIIGKIPSGLAEGEYFVVVKNDSGHASNENIHITIVAGDPLPGLCRLTPNTGVSPLPKGFPPLKISGINLMGGGPIVYFWTVGSDEKKINTWLSSDVFFDLDKNNPLKSVSENGTEILTTLPINEANGNSMTTGPIRVSVNNKLSNSVTYTVNDCTLGGSAPEQNYQCCTTGPEKGLWKPQALACSGETRTAGYLWRFTTGLIPKVPRVLEACNIEDWKDLSVNNFVRPSPSPWQNWNVGNACTDSLITLQFNMHMSDANLANAIRVYTCGQGDAPDCVYDADHDVTSHYIPQLLVGQEDILELKFADGQIHSSDTWYRVILGNALRANEHTADGKVNTAALSLQRPLDKIVNGITVAYNFDFKTGNARCTLFGAAITPPSYTTHLLGVIQNTDFPISNNFDNPAHPFYFYVWGRGTQACSVVDANEKGWMWKPRKNVVEDASSTFAYSVKSDTVGIPKASSTYYKDVRATATALQNTLLTPVVITATTNTVVDGVPRDITGSSNLYIQLGDPTVVQKWPECNESCTNVNIGVRFNLPMLTNTYRVNRESAIKVQKCLGLGENCQDLADPIHTEDVNDGGFDPYQYEVKIPNSLELNTLYQVTVTNQIHSFGGILNGSAIDGKPLVPAVWKFRTKVKDGICILDKVDVVPNPYIASMVGEKTAYGASALSSPDQCSPMGQRLNPWAYGWNWSVDHMNVATTSHFSTQGNPQAFCTGTCLPGGSDIPLGQTQYLCGNGQVDPGEDCDIAANINGDNNTPETPGVSCTLNCLRPGNQNLTTTVNPQNLGLCGNGAVEPNLGEECDPGIPGEKPYCSNTCNWKGSNQEFSNDVNTLQCGNGRVGLAENGLDLVGEECDLGISLETALSHHAPAWASLGCSQNCLHQGTSLSRAYCENANSRLNDDQRKSPECRQSVTICGDGRLDPGEECEINPNNDEVLTVFKDGNAIDVIAVASAKAVCSNYCVLKNICEIKDKISSDFTCAKGNEGCNNDCTKSGSSVQYSQPSLCGDGRFEVGENQRCETDVAAENVNQKEDPLQIVTALGNGDVNPLTSLQEAHIFASASQVKKSRTSIMDLDGNVFKGTGNYALQCGYIEYTQPVVQDGITRSNNCPDASQGVGTNSCCQLRPHRIVEYPPQASGIADNAQICRNTYIEATFDHSIDPASVGENILIASLHPAGYNCASSSETNVTQEVNSLILASIDVDQLPKNIFAKIWNEVKQFFVDIFNSVVHAIGEADRFVSIQNEINGKVWCVGNINPTVAVNPVGEVNVQSTSTVGIYINNLLDANTTYAVVLRGGNSGLKDINGVGIRGTSLKNIDNSFIKDDVILFKTSNEICKIKSVSVSPTSQLFQTPSSTHHFVASVHSTNGGSIVSTPSYAWEWSWQPENNNLFTLSLPTSTPEINITSKDIQGNLVMSAQALISADKSIEGNELGKIYSGITNLTSLFCENPWPSLETYPYEDGVSSYSLLDDASALNNDNFSRQTRSFDGRPISPIVVDGGSPLYLNFGFGYCADAGKPATTTDDLPILQPIVSGNLVLSGRCSLSQSTCFADAQCGRFNGHAQLCMGERVDPASDLSTSILKKFLFFNTQNNDVIGLQVFPNSERKTARQWFVDQQFSGIDKYQNIVIDGYDAISDGNNTYINALNELSDKRIHNYIYLFGINSDAQESTRKVLEQILTNLKFNINIPERNQCLSGDGLSGGQYLPLDLTNLPITSIGCESDYDCRDALGAPKTGTNGICADAKTKFKRDWERLSVIRDIQSKVENFHTQKGGYPVLPAGTYVPGYTNTHWPSWSRLIEAIGPISSVPLNTWGACGYCETPVQTNGQSHYVACTSDSQCAAGDAHNDLGKCTIPDDQDTCWNSQTATFACPAISNVLEYSATSSTNYKLFLPLEYFNPLNPNQDQIINQFVSEDHFSAAPYCGENGLQVIRPAAGSCGNGIREQGEDCDPVGTSVAGNIACPVGQNSFKTCNATCHYDDPICRSGALCGNGHIDGVGAQREQCDDGNLNGTYGHCTLSCGPAQAQNDRNHQNAGFCGDGIRNYNDKNHNGNQDAGEDFFEACDVAETRFVGRGYCSRKPSQFCGDWNGDEGPAHYECKAEEGNCLSANDPTYNMAQGGSCSADCQSLGGYCGDGKLQMPDETCDDGNKENLDGCSTYCKVENNACANSIPNADRLVQNGNTILTIHFGAEHSNACSQTTGDSICRGVGLTCEDVDIAQDNPSPVEALRNQCERIFAANIKTNVTITCDGQIEEGNNAAVVPAGSCGDGHQDEGEVCDTGIKNGIMCNPEYGLSCSYCSSDCKKVLNSGTKDACGNGKIDIDFRDPVTPGTIPGEVCDIDPVTNQVKVLDKARAEAEIISHPQLALPNNNPNYRDYIRSVYNRFTIDSMCSAAAGRVAAGTVQCTNECRVLDTGSCVACGDYNNAGKAIPKLAVLNVLTPTSINSGWGNQQEYFSSIQNEGPAFHRNLFLNNFLNTWSRTNPISGGNASPSICQSTGWTNAGADGQVINSQSQACNNPNSRECIALHRKYRTGANTTNYMRQQWICSDGNGFPLDTNYGYQTVLNPEQPVALAWNWGNYTEKVLQIESNAMCNGQYSVYFGARGVQEKRLAEFNATPNAGKKDFYSRYGSFFPYPVNGEFGVIQNEFVLSPAVAKDTFRIVVKSKHFIDVDVTFSPVIYNRDFLVNENVSNAEKLASTVSYLSAASYNFAHRNDEPRPNRICTQMEQLYVHKTPEEQQALASINILNYWLPSNCESFHGHKVFNDPNHLSRGDVYVHESGTLANTQAQALTVVTGNTFGTQARGEYSEPYAVFVQAVTPQGTIPITSFNNMDVTVEVYNYHENQVPEYSMYAPIKVFTLRAASLSNNGNNAKYWHVFNLVKGENGKYDIEKVYDSVQNKGFDDGTTVTDFVDILCRVPGETCSRDQ